jgi:hypothetical protein
MVMSVKWTDPRVTALVPEGLDQLSLAWSQANTLIWMPGIVVTNRDIEKYEIVSASVTIFKSGEILRVERAQARVMKKFQLETYPFDTQHLLIKTASSKYMLNEVKIVPDRNASAVEESSFGLYNVHGWKITAEETMEGELKKSRGVMDVEVERSLSKYIDDHLVPTFIVLVISWAVFYFPFANPFITARLALSVLALLTFTNLMVKSTKELPGPAPFNWNDLFNQQIQTFMFMTIVLNICSEILFHQFQMEDIARRINLEAKFFVPFASTLNITLILSSAHWELVSLQFCTHLTKALVVLLVVCYGGHVLHKVHLQRKGEEKIDGKTDAEQGEQGADADCDM